ncbi:SusC/RagA family TonB-linked outer membrane protein [Dysgonomonas capnocytophagoides]|uniref:SusC/RagA family TonB-linked outer membrane protein n=1 Tax=Dysgonomonas capnocytophagoides TaxID=45254 RepID=UPI00291D2ECB|nr:TonB-dependent receptor [Dysgonomonas capnocytophagoides]
MKKIFNLLFFFCVIPALVFAQNLQIKGKVTDAKDGSPLVGVTVKTQKNSGVMTDLDGKYTINAQKGDILSFSFLSMTTQTVKVESAKDINIALSDDDKILDEIVVVGYGTMKKRDLSGSVGQIKSEDLLKGNPTSSINQALQGRLAGVSVSQNDGAPGAGISITIRGTNSFSTNSQPLYIVDGIPYDVAATPTSSANDNNNQTANALAAINPHDIESVEVLKDASATAIYGSRGANGVVLITTKKGEKGSNKIEFTSNFSVSKIGKKVKMLDPVTYARYINEQTVNSGNYEGIPYTTLPYSGTWQYQYLNGEIITSSGVYNPSPEDFNNYGIRKDQYGNETLVEGANWQNEIYQTGASQEYNLSVSGANEAGWYAFSGNYTDQSGIIKNSGYKRYALRTNIGRRLRSWLEIGTNINYTNSTTDFAKSNAYDYSIIRSALLFPTTYGPNMTRTESDELNWLASNPLIYVNTAKDQLKANNVFSSSYAEIKFMDGLKFRQNLGLGYSGNNRFTYYNRQTQEGRDAKGKGGQSDNWWYSTTAESLLTFDKTFNTKHTLNAVGGFTYEQSNYGGKSMTATNFPNDITEYYDLSAGLNKGALVTNRGQAIMVSLLGRVNYSYDGKYIATVSFRRDGSSKLTSGHKFANFASGALAWRISDEKLIKDLKIFDNLKLRLSYGQTGNQGVSSYQTMEYLTPANYPVGGALTSGFAEVDWRGALNRLLKWERTDQYNAGLDISVLNSKVNFTIDAYYKKTNDLLQNVAIPSSSGFLNMWMNSGWVTNKGLEITGQFYPYSNKNFSWDINANISFNKNEIGGLNGDSFSERLWYGADNIFIRRNGAPIGAIYGYVEDGFYDNAAEVRADPQYANASDAKVKSMIGEIKYRDVNHDGVVNESDRVIIGDTNPDFIFGLTNNFKWKQFTLSFFFQGSVGNDIFNGNLLDVKMGNIANIPTDIYNSRWTEENKEGALWPKAVASYNRTMLVSDRYIENGSYLRLKNLNIGYSFKPKFKGVDNIYIYGSATNLFTISDYSWFDPDVNAFGSDSSRRGVDIYSYPSSRTYSIGLKLDF